MKLPKYVEIEMQYSYLNDPVVYLFPRRRKADADLDQRERLFGDGKKLKSSERFSGLVEDISGVPGFEPRGGGEGLKEFQARVSHFFGDEDGEELASDALVGRENAIYPRVTFRDTSDNRLAVNLLREQTAGAPMAGVSEVHTIGTRSKDGVSDVPVDTGPQRTET